MTESIDYNAIRRELESKFPAHFIQSATSSGVSYTQDCPSDIRDKIESEFNALVNKHLAKKQSVCVKNNVPKIQPKRKGIRF
jgi:hypothetical protein